MRRKNLLRTAIFGFVCSMSFTACTFEFNVNNEEPFSPIDTSAINEIAEHIDNTDFTNKEDVDNLAETVNTWADTVSGDYIGEFQSATLVRVVDGDTIVVDINGDEARVRLIGVNTPESVAGEEYLERTGKQNTEEGKEASEYTKDILEDVETVYLQTDTSDTDRYDRLLRYVWLEVPEDCNDTEEIETKMLNAILLEDHIADVAIYEPDTRYAEVFEEIYDR